MDPLESKRIEERLKGGHPNSLGATLEVVEDVLQKPELFHELFECYFSSDEIVRLRVSNAIKRIAKPHPGLVVPYLDRLIQEISKIDQASAQWTLSQLFLILEKYLSPIQKEEAKTIMKDNLVNHSDWIVLCQTMETLSKWAQKDHELSKWLMTTLDKHKQDTRKAVKSKALKISSSLS